MKQRKSLSSKLYTDKTKYRNHLLEMTQWVIFIWEAENFAYKNISQNYSGSVDNLKRLW